MEVCGRRRHDKLLLASKGKISRKAYSIQLYSAAFQFLQSNYHSLGLLRDICVMLGTEIVYAQVK